jgi:hypothetical protein
MVQFSSRFSYDFVVLLSLSLHQPYVFVAIKMAAIVGAIGILLGLGGSKTAEQAQVAAEAQTLHNGDLIIQLDSENGQIIFAALENKDIKPIVFDLKKGLVIFSATGKGTQPMFFDTKTQLISNAAFPPTAEELEKAELDAMPPAPA